MVMVEGRDVAVHVVADGGGRTVVWCHGAPGSGDFDPDPVVTAGRGIRLVGVDRPGYGGSAPVAPGEWCTVGRVADDLASVVDGRVGVVGWSSGGRVALALAARHPELVDRVAVVATPAPDEHVPWLPDGFREALAGLRDGAPEDAYGKLQGDLDVAQVMDGLAEGAADAALLREPAVESRVRGMVERAFAQGNRGLLSDQAGALVQPWGFEPGQVAAKTLLLYGALDPVVGVRHGKWWQRNLPDARFEQVPDAGHLVIVSMWRRVLAHLAPRRNKS